jgi:arylsulfatase A
MTNKEGQLSRRDLLKMVVAGTLTAWASSLPGKAAPSETPNFILLLADDLGWADLSCYGSRFHETPNLDRLASSGIRFTHAYAACPVCSPTRASIMTGKYPARLHLTNFIPGKHTIPHSKLVSPQFHQQLPLEETTMAEVLQSAGYKTGYFGKWHLGGQGFTPTDQGFDTNAASAGVRSVPPLEPGVNEGHGLTSARLTDHALRFIEANQAGSFFVYLSYYDVHIPLETTPEYVERYTHKADENAPQRNPLYAGMVRSLDDSVGRIADKLKELGLDRKTIVVFASDNGGLIIPEWSCQIATSNQPLRSGKGNLYEGGIRVPLIVSCPGLVRQGIECSEPVISTDFFPTFAELAGVRQSGPGDGISLLPLLKNDVKPVRRELFWHYPHYSNQGGRPSGAVRQGDYKLVEFYEDSRCELYNLNDDPGETRDLAKSDPDRTAAMRALLHAWLAETRADMPSPNPAHDPARELEGPGVAWRQKCNYQGDPER